MQRQRAFLQTGRNAGHVCTYPRLPSPPRSRDVRTCLSCRCWCFSNRLRWLWRGVQCTPLDTARTQATPRTVYGADAVSRYYFIRFVSSFRGPCVNTGKRGKLTAELTSHVLLLLLLYIRQLSNYEPPKRRRCCRLSGAASSGPLAALPFFPLLLADDFVVFTPCVTGPPPSRASFWPLKCPLSLLVRNLGCRRHCSSLLFLRWCGGQLHLPGRQTAHGGRPAALMEVGSVTATPNAALWSISLQFVICCFLNGLCYGRRRFSIAPRNRRQVACPKFDPISRNFSHIVRSAAAPLVFYCRFPV